MRPSVSSRCTPPASICTRCINAPMRAPVKKSNVNDWMWSCTRRRISVSSFSSTCASIQALASARICAATSVTAQMASRAANGSGVANQPNGPEADPSPRLSSAPFRSQTAVRFPARPASAIACMTGPKAALDTNGSADAIRPRGQGQRDQSAHGPQHGDAAPDVLRVHQLTPRSGRWATTGRFCAPSCTRPLRCRERDPD